MKNTVSMTVIYGVLMLAAFLLMIGYRKLIREQEKWLQYLYIAVFGSNAGYFLLSMSGNLQSALVTNGIVELCSVWLPFFMLMLMMKVCGVHCPKGSLGMLICAGCLIFLLRAGGGYHTLYYRNVEIDFIHGAAVLRKHYGSLHFVDGLYVFLYFAGMLGIILYTIRQKAGKSSKLAVFLAAAVLCNVSTWVLEQLLDTEFEWLAVSYVFTELLLLLLYMILEDRAAEADVESAADKREKTKGKELAEEHYGNTLLADKKTNETEGTDTERTNAGNETISNQIQIRTAGTDLTGIEKLSVREMEVLLLIMDNKKRKDIAEELDITENTVKKHTSHIFSKLGVSSRKELFAKCSHVTENNVTN